MKKGTSKVKDKSAPAPTTAYEGQAFDVMLHAWLGRFTGWLSPASLSLALFDWVAHLGLSPAKQVDIMTNLSKNITRLNTYTFATLLGIPLNIPCFKTRPDDSRFKDPSWGYFPFYLYSQGFLLAEQFFDSMTCKIRGVSDHHQQVVNFATRQMLDVFSPSNFVWTNPEVLQKTYQTSGMNFVEGYKNITEDFSRLLFNLPPAGTDKFKVGENMAITPGKVIYRNHLIELIQYEPSTTKVYSEPILIIPAWIMKYYILDLSAHNSLVKYLVENGHTVFMISWRNPDSDDRNLGFDSYIQLGVMDALEAIQHIVPGEKIHTVGYCLGGTLLMMVAAAMAGAGDNRIKTITLFAAQIDYRDAGELQIFIDPSQVSYLEDAMWERGYLDGPQMASAFSMLRSNDLIWSRLIRDYLMGERLPMNDLIAWDNDMTRLPYRMHSQYLHSLFLNNDLVQGGFKVDKKKIALNDIRVPIFAVGTRKDHVSPWESVYKLNLFTDCETTFVLTSGGHNAGIVSEPGHKGRSFQMSTSKRGEKYLNPEKWLEQSKKHKGSWWPEWQKWLVNKSDEKKKPPEMGNPEKGYTVICDAPGTYVFQK